MMSTINTNIHISDGAYSITIDKENTIFSEDNSINNLQNVLEKFNLFSVDGSQNATIKRNGLVKLSGDSPDDVVTTREFIRLSTEIKADENVLGAVIYSEFVDNGNYNDSTSITPKTFKDCFNDRKSNYNRTGIQRFSNKNEIDSRKGDSILTPKDLSYSLKSMVPKETTASREEYGLVKIVNKNDLYGKAKDYDSGYAISPKTFGESKASETYHGIGKYTQKWNSPENSLLDPRSLIQFKATINQLSKNVFDLKEKNNKEKIIFNSEAERIAKEIISKRKESILDSIMEIGDITIMATTTQTSRLKSLNGQALFKPDHEKLFSVIGYKYGGSGNYFNLPDARGMTMKMQGKGGLISGGLGNIKSFNTGEILPMRVAPHKHAGFGTRNQTGEKFFGLPRTKIYMFHGTRRNPDYRNALRYGDYGAQFTEDFVTQNPVVENQDTRTWNISLNYMMRVR